MLLGVVSSHPAAAAIVGAVAPVCCTVPETTISAPETSCATVSPETVARVIFARADRLHDVRLHPAPVNVNAPAKICALCRGDSVIAGSVTVLEAVPLD